MNGDVVADVDIYIVVSLLEEKGISVVVELPVVDWLHASLGGVDGVQN